MSAREFGVFLLAWALMVSLAFNAHQWYRWREALGVIRTLTNWRRFVEACRALDALSRPTPPDAGARDDG